jgi:HK97 family phage portal protein
MGLIASRLAERSETRSVQDWLNDDDEDGARTSAGVKVTRGTALTVPTFLRGMDILASVVAGSPRDVVIKVGSRTFPEYSNVPRWVDQPDPTDPTLTSWRYIYSLVSSLVVDGNYFVHAYPNVLAPEVLTALDPRRVRTPEGSSDFEVLDGKGKVIAVLSPNEVLHGVMYPWSGERRGPAPLDLMARTIGSAIAADDFAARFFGQGAALSFGVEVPNQLTEEQKKTLRESLKARHQGNRNSHAIGVLTAGAKFIGGLAPTPEQAQMLETRKFSVEEFARFLGVPPFMLGSQEPGAASYASTNIAKDAFSEFTVLPLVQRVEDQHNRLLADFAPVKGGRAQFKLNMDHLLRADLLARYQAYETGIRSGVLKPDEAREKENLAPQPGGDRLYMQAQMTPIEMLGQPAPVPAPTRSDEYEARMLEAIATRPTSTEVHTHLSAESLRIDPPIVNIPAFPAFPEIPATVVQVDVAAPIVTIPDFPALPDVRVDVAAPAVTVNTPSEIAITRMPTRIVSRRVTKRDTKGAIAETQDVEADA